MDDAHQRRGRGNDGRGSRSDYNKCPMPIGNMMNRRTGWINKTIYTRIKAVALALCTTGPVCAVAPVSRMLNPVAIALGEAVSGPGQSRRDHDRRGWQWWTTC